MKQIPLSRGLFATVDDADFDWLNQWKWSACESKKGRGDFIAVRMEMVGDGRQRVIKMHRQIAGADVGEKVDHWDRNRLNNTRLNLRVCTQQQNTLNRGPNRERKLAGGKGVYWHKAGQKWMAMFRSKYLGLFATESEAAAAYDAAAKAFDVKFSLTNAELRGEA